MKNIEIRTPATNFIRNQYNQGETNTNMNTNTSTGTNANAKTANRSKRPANSSYSCLFFVASNSVVATRPACSDPTRLIREKIAKLQREDQCFHCKKVGDHRPRCSKKWRSMTVLTNSVALAQVNVSEMAVPQPGHVEAENK